MIPFLQNTIDKRVDERINEIIKSNRDFEPRDISDEEAREEISDFILEQKRAGNLHLTTLDFVLNLRLPAEQAERILEEFKSEHKVKEINHV